MWNLLTGRRTLRFVRVGGDYVEMPEYATAGAAAMDFRAPRGCRIDNKCVTSVPLGLAVEIPKGKAILLTARSGHGLRYGAGVPQGYGLIDSDYRGELKILFCTSIPFDVKAGERVCQGLVIDAPQYQILIAQALSTTARGAGGFGSTGAGVQKC